MTKYGLYSTTLETPTATIPNVSNTNSMHGFSTNKNNANFSAGKMDSQLQTCFNF